MSGKMYGLREASAILDISYMTLYRLVKQGKIRAVKIGAKLKITDEELERVKREGA